jgi:hypothetical protein
MSLLEEKALKTVEDANSLKKELSMIEIKKLEKEECSSKQSKQSKRITYRRQQSRSHHRLRSVVKSAPITLQGMCVNCPPRTRNSVFKDREFSWSVENSVFKDRKSEAHSEDFWDTPEYLGKVFDSDWSFNKLSRVITERMGGEDELEKCKLYVRKLFQRGFILNIYQLYAVFNTSRNSVSIQV